MKVKIENERVCKNIELFLQILNRFLSEKKPLSSPQKVYQAYINKVNGEMLYSDLLPNPSLLENRDWKKVQLCCDSKDGVICFEVAEAQKDPQSFLCEELAPLAYQTVAETIRLLNQCAEHCKPIASPEEQLKELCDLAIEPSSLKAPYDLIQAAWHPLDRWQAEKMLSKHPYGSFIFRKDVYAKWLEEILSVEHGYAIRCFTLTLLESDKKVSDLTLVFRQEECQIYNDDPSLKGKTYVSLQELLLDLEPRCKYPVYH